MLDAFKDKSNDELFVMYRATKRLDIKHELVLRYVPVVKSIAIQMRNVFLSFSQVDDMVNEGVLVLMNSIEKFDESMGVKFETYISKRIRGMIIDLARKNDWIPRNIRKKVKDVANVTTELYNEKGSMPSIEEIADKADITVDKYYELQGHANVFNVLSLDTLIEDADDAFSGINVSSEGELNSPPEKDVLHDELKEVLQESIKKLNEKEQLVISLYYIDELNMKDIAKVLDISAPRVSQIHSGAITKLRKSITDYLNS